MKRFNACLLSLITVLSYLLVSGLAAPTNIPASSARAKEGPWRLPRALGGDDLPEIVVFDILVIETAPLPIIDAAAPPAFYQTPQAATPLDRPTPIGPLRFTPLNKVGARMVKQRRDVDVARDDTRHYVRVGGQSPRTSPAKRDVDVDGEPGPIAEVDEDTLRRVARVERRATPYNNPINRRDLELDGAPGPVVDVDRDDANRVLLVEDWSTLSRRSIERRNIDLVGPATGLEKRQDTSAPKNTNTNAKSDAQPNTNTKQPSSNSTPTDPIRGKNGAVSNTPASRPLKSVLGSKTDGLANGLLGVVGGGSGVPMGLNVPQELSGKLKVPGL